MNGNTVPIGLPYGCKESVEESELKAQFLIAVIQASYFGQTPAVKVLTLEKPRRS